MGGCCCCCASKTTELNSSPPFFHYPQSEERQPLSSNHAAVSTGLLVDTNLDTSAPDTYRPPPAPIPYEKYVGHPTTPSASREVSLQTSNNTEAIEHSNASSTLTKIKNHEKEGIEIQEVEDAEFDDDDLKKSIGLVIPLPEEEDCPICLEEYDGENPKNLTKCDHHFHLACILEWMERSEVCPVCDQEMVLITAIEE